MNLTISVGRLRLCGLIELIQNGVLIVAFLNKTTNRKVYVSHDQIYTATENHAMQLIDIYHLQDERDK